MGDFDNQVVIVTGGAIGMGGDTALEFARQGAKVTVADINRDAGSANVKRIVDRGFEGLFVEADVTLGVCPRIRSWRRKPPRNNLLTVIWTLSWSN